MIPQQQQYNSLLCTGYTNDKSFVVRGLNIGIFNNTQKDVEYETTISMAKEEAFIPRKIMLHKQDNNMLILHPTMKETVYNMDLHNGKTCERWHMNDFNVKEILPINKNAQSTSASTLLGLNTAGFFMIDARMEEKIIKDCCFQYANNQRFSCGATTNRGDLVLGTSKGTIKLFNHKKLVSNAYSRHNAKKINGIYNKIKATSNLNNITNEIIGIDVTADGNWILATCKTYLLLIFSGLEDNTTGFDKPLISKGVKMFYLNINANDKTVKNVSFTPAQFNAGNNAEKHILTSTGKFLITWDFEKMKKEFYKNDKNLEQCIIREYQIKKYEYNIILDKFRYKDDKSIVVLFQNDVCLSKI